MSAPLFYLFTNDIPDIIGVDEDTPKLNKQAVNCLMYADDVVLLSTSPHSLQNQLNTLHQYCNKWHLNVNIQKTKIIEFNCKYDGAYCQPYYKQ